MHPGRDAVDRQLGEMLPERVEQAVSASPVRRARAADVAVVVAAREELGQRELLQGRREDVEEQLRARRLVDEMGRRYEPTQPQRWRESFETVASWTT